MHRSPLTRFAPAAIIVAAAVSLGGCWSAAVGAGAAVGVAAYEERGVTGVAQDLALEVSITEAWFSHDHLLPTKLALTVYQGRALVAGEVADEKTRADAVRLAWSIDGVRDVINEIQVVEGESDRNVARDLMITTSLRSTLTLDDKVMAVNYAVKTVNDQVYLLGTAQSRWELDRVVAHAKSIDYVRRVTNHVRVRPNPGAGGRGR